MDYSLIPIFHKIVIFLPCICNHKDSHQFDGIHIIIIYTPLFNQGIFFKVTNHLAVGFKTKCLYSCFQMMMNAFQYFSGIRIVLRQMTDNDTHSVFVLRSHPDILKYVKKVVAKSETDALAFIRSINEKMNAGNLFYWAIADKNSDELMGTICFWNISADKSFGEIGYEILPEYQKQGFAQEAIALVMHYSFSTLKFRKLQAWIHPQNMASIHVIKKFGFTLQARSQSEFNELEDEDAINCYAITARKYFNQLNKKLC